MNLYRDSMINVISFLISISIFFLSEFFIFYFSEPGIKFQAEFSQGVVEQQEMQENVQENVNYENIQETVENIPNIVENSLEEHKIGDWYIKIPAINLVANIEEGTSQEVMELYVGHFEETSKFVGNVGLAAHNRGYTYNYFERLKELKNGDEIEYGYHGQVKRYQVEKQMIIKDTDWTNLENTEENRITLITCVENEPSYRRCVFGREN